MISYLKNPTKQNKTENKIKPTKHAAYKLPTCTAMVEVSFVVQTLAMSELISSVMQQDKQRGKIVLTAGPFCSLLNITK